MSRTRPALISLGVLGHVLGWLVAIGVVVGLGKVAVRQLAGLQRGSAMPHQARPPIAWRLIAYRLDPVRPTVFRFSQPLAQTRIITLPVIAPGQASPGEGWVYAIRLELLDNAGTIIETRVVHSHSVLLERDGQRRGALRYYRGRDDVIGPADEVRISGKRPFAALRVFSAAADPDVIAVDVRVSEQRPLTESAAASAFVRFSPIERKRISAANAFPPELLTSEERIGLAVHQWRPVGPVGIDGRDYRMGVMYEEIDGAGMDDEAGSTDEGVGG